MAGRNGASGAWDTIVVGAGHNALVTAAYLARAGRRTLVLERRQRVGGAAETAALGGVRVPRLAHTVGRLRPSIVRDLELRRHGLQLVAPDVRVFAPQADDRAVTLWADEARTVESLRAWSPRDAERYPDFDRLVRSLGRFLGDLAGRTPPDIRSPGLGDALTGLRLGRTFRGLGRHDAHTILRVLPMAVADFVAEAFETDAVQAAIAWRGVQYCAVGPWSAGTTAILLGDSAGNDGGAAGQTVFALGGPGALSEALAAAARAAGAEIRCGAEVAAITSRDGAVTGVALASGEEISAPSVVSGLDPKRTLTGLCDPVAIGPTLRWRAGNYRTPGVVSKVNLVLDGLPRFRAAGGEDETLLRGRIVVAPGIDTIERAFDAAKYGNVSDRLVFEATVPSLVDPSLVDGAPAGTHVVSVLAQYTPYRLREGSWDDAERREGVGNAVVGALEELAPGFSSLIRDREVLSPLDLEREYGLSGGHPLHGEPGLDQFFLWRPLLGHARYRLPIDGLYLAGSGAHPGGGVTGQPGHNAAREILADRRRPGRG
ncbi:MAG TPA: NAD(P)/FAD-dependent oxidoreductase [Candidatus Limnocylindrales bacterium]|nr:NAD(P)/FAD-dependent oxidoreductase [Candidatus Limnocylindrales bacterium]